MMSIEGGNGTGSTFSSSVSIIKSICSTSSNADEKIEDLHSQRQRQQNSEFHLPLRKKRRMSKENINNLLLLIQNTWLRTSETLNTEAIQIIAAGISGMLLLPLCYTAGLIMTTPTITSVWDGPMIPLGCFFVAVALKLEKRSDLYPRFQVWSLLLAVGGSLIVLMADFIHGNNHKNAVEKEAGMNHMQIIQGNMLLSGVVASYSATSLLQKQLTRHPPITLTGWMFCIGFICCFCLLLLDSFLVGGTLTGCTLGQAVKQLLALTTSATFQYGLLYSALFVGGACFSIGSYASAHLESSVITLFAACQPPMTAVLEWIWEGMGFGWKKGFGMCCVCCGLFGFTYIKRLEGRPKQKSPVIKRYECKIPIVQRQIQKKCGGTVSTQHNSKPNLSSLFVYAVVRFFIIIIIIVPT